MTELATVVDPARLRQVYGAFPSGVSVLAADQEAAGAQLAARSGYRFAGLDWRTTADDTAPPLVFHGSRFRRLLP